MDGVNPFDAAVRAKVSDDILVAMLDASASGTAQVGGIYGDLLLAALKGRRGSLVTAMLRAGAELSSAASSGDTPLNTRGSAVVLQLSCTRVRSLSPCRWLQLLDANQTRSMNARYHIGRTALFRTVASRNPALVQLLLDKGADMLVEDGMTVLLLDSGEDVKRVLLDHLATLFPFLDRGHEYL